MADPLSITASVLAVATAAIVSVRSLCDTIKRFENRNNTLRRLQHTLQDLAAILDSLTLVVNADASTVTLLRGPVDRCKETCTELEQSMKQFHGKSKTGLLDWTKLEFMRGDINDFIDTIEGYKSTITVGLGTITLRNSTVSLEVLHQYEEVIKDTTYNLEVHLQRIDEKLAQNKSQANHVTNANIDLRDERVVTQQCLRICQDASGYIESLAARESPFLQNTPQATQRGKPSEDFEAQVLVREALSTSQATLSGVIQSLSERLRSAVVENRNGNDEDRSRLQEDLNMSKQCLEVCKMAGEVYHQKIHTIGEAIAEDDSDQVVVTTLADLFDVRKALSKGRSAQLVATLTPENFDHVVDKRYSSRFGVPADHSAPSRNGSAIPTDLSISRDDRRCVLPATSADGRPPSLEARRDKPSSNEMRKRYGDTDGGRGPASPRD